MMTVEIHRYRSKLDNLFKKFDEIPTENDLLRAHWSRYLCVLVCGYIEVSVKEILGSYSEKSTNRNVANFVESQLKGFQNPKMEKILQLVGAFNQDWREDLNRFAEGQLKDAIDTIVSNRNQIAHGQDSGMSVVRIQTYYADAQKVIQYLQNLCT